MVEFLLCREDCQLWRHAKGLSKVDAWIAELDKSGDELSSQWACLIDRIQLVWRKTTLVRTKR